MQEAHVRCGIILLRIAQLRPAPIARLLLLGYVLAQHLAHQFLQPVPIGIGAHQLAGDLGAEHRRGRHPHIILDGGQIESAEMIQLHPRRIGQDALQIGRIVAGAGVETDQMLIPVAIGNLQQAQSVPRGAQAHRFRIDGQIARFEDAIGQVFFVKMHGQGGDILYNR